MWNLAGPDPTPNRGRVRGNSARRCPAKRACLSADKAASAYGPCRHPRRGYPDTQRLLDTQAVKRTRLGSVNRWRWEVDPEGVMAAGLITFLGFIAGGRGWALAGIFGFWFVLGGIDFRKMPLPELNREERLHASAIFVSGEEPALPGHCHGPSPLCRRRTVAVRRSHGPGGVAVDDAGVTFSIRRRLRVWRNSGAATQCAVASSLAEQGAGMIGFRHPT